jgi:hypothetical protein
MVTTVNLITDALLPFITNRILLEGLSVSDVHNFKAEKLKWRVSFIDRNGIVKSEVELGGEDRWFAREQWDNLLLNLVSKISEFPLVGIPGGFLGIQALYILLENFWRNLVKHNFETVVERIENGFIQVHIELKDKPETPFWECELWADIPTKQNNVAEDIGKILKEGIIDEQGQLIAEGWGTKEMLIAAASLKAAPLMDAQQKGVEILRCSMRQGGYLSYKFDLLKPMHLGVISTEAINANLKRELMTKGVYLFDSIPQNFIIPTEYLVVQKQGGISLEESLIPLKRSEEDVPRIEDLKNENELLELLIKLESDFAMSLLSANMAVRLVILSPDSPDKQLLNPGNHRKSLELGDKMPEQLDNKFTIVLDRHGSAKERIDEWFQQQPQLIFWEPYGGGTHTAFTLQNVPANPLKIAHLRWKVVTSALLKVVVLDERIQQILCKEGLQWRYGEGPPIPPIDCLERMRIYIPRPSECSLEKPINERIKNFVTSKQPHILCVHIGILDKIGYKSEDEVLEWIKQAKAWMDANVQRVIIHSGRGIPPNVPEFKVPFIGYTAVEHWLTSKDLKSKYALVGELLSARGVKR